MASSVAAVVLALAIAIGLIFTHSPGWSEEEWAIAEPNPSLEAERPPLSGSCSESKWVKFYGGRNGKTQLVGKLCLPNSTEMSPLVILAHGLGLSQDCSLGKFANAFVEQGMATFTFDYATFGHSFGSPRHMVDPITHISDIRAAVATLQEKSNELGIDSEAIGLWGTSLGGGHVMSAALDDTLSTKKSIKAVVSQVPHLASGIESVLGTFISDPITYAPALARVLAGVMKGLIVSVSGSNWYLPLHGKPGSAAAMQNPGDEEGYGSLCPPNLHESGHWKNSMTFGSVIRILFYRPLTKLIRFRPSEDHDLPPILLVAAEQDTLCPALYAKQLAERIRNAELLLLDSAGHFDVYDKELEKTIQHEIKFLKKHLMK